MKRSLSALALWGLGGLGTLAQGSCTPPLDLCADAAAACLTVQVTADTTDPVDLLRALYTVGADGRKEMQFASPPGGSPLPAGFALNLTSSGAVDLQIIAERGLRPQLRGSAQLTLGDGEHQQVTITLNGDLSGLPYVGPAPRHHAGMIYFPPRRAVVLFGGIGSDGGYLNDTWELNVDSNTWSVPPTMLGTPTARAATLAYAAAAQRLVLTGGAGAGGTVVQDTWIYGPMGNWLQAPVTNRGGGSRTSAAMTVTDAGIVIVGGGIDPAVGTVLQDVVTCDLNSAAKGNDFVPHLPVAALPPIKTPKLVNISPAASMGVNSEVYLFGASEAMPNSPIGVWQLSGQFATSMSPITATAIAAGDAAAPSRRTDFALTTDPDAGLIYLFGGTNPTGESLSDTYVFNVATKQWAKVSAELTPLARAGAQLALLPPGVLLLGGLGGPTGSAPLVATDTWKLTTNTFAPPTLPGVFVRRP